MRNVIYKTPSDTDALIRPLVQVKDLATDDWSAECKTLLGVLNVDEKNPKPFVMSDGSTWNYCRMAVNITIPEGWRQIDLIEEATLLPNAMYWHTVLSTWKPAINIERTGGYRLAEGVVNYFIAPENPQPTPSPKLKNGERRVSGEMYSMDTAPKDGTYVLLFGYSGYNTTPLRCEVCRYDHRYRPHQPWVNHADNSFTDGGSYPVAWSPLPPTPEWF